MLLNIQVVLLILTVGYLKVGWAGETTEKIYLKTIEVKSKKSSSKSTELIESSPETLEVNFEKNRTLTQILQTSASVFAQENGTEGAPRLLLRAQDPIENRYFLEGVPLTDAQFNSEQITVLSMHSVGSIDIFPDGAPVGLASDGLGGAIDFHLDPTSRERIALKTGSFNYGELFARGIFGRNDRNLNLNLARSDENYMFYDDGGTPFNPQAGQMKSREHNRFFRIGLVPSFSIFRSRDFDLKYFGLNSFRDLEIPGSTSLPQLGKLTQWFHLSALSTEGWLKSYLKIKTTLFAKLDSQEYLADKNVKTKSIAESNRSQEKALGFRNQFQWYSFFPTRIEQTIAGNYEWYELKSVDNPKKKTNNSRLEVPISVSSMIPYRLFEITTALMIHSTFYEGAAEKNYHFASPRLGFEKKEFAGVKELSWQNSVGRYYRAPSMQELNGNPFGLSPAGNLLPERADKLSTGLVYTTHNGKSWLSAISCSYHYALSFSKNLITYTQNSQNSQVANNVGSSLIQTHEGALNVRLFGGVELDSKAILQKTKNLSDLPYHYGMKLPNRPEFRFLERIGYEASRFGLAYQVQWIGERYWDLANTKKMGSNSEHGISLNYRPKQFGQFSLELANIFDSFTAYSMLSGFQTLDNTTGYFGYPAPGRRLYLNWTYQL